MLKRNVILYGNDEDLPKEVILKAGPLELIYQAAEIRYIKFNGLEIVRRIYAAVRDRNWGTAPNVITNEEIDICKDSFRIKFDVNNQLDDISFNWHGLIEGDPQGKIRYTFDGCALSTFSTCRIGFCILHPLQTCTGKSCLIEKESGEKVYGEFPRFITSGEIPPFLDMTGMVWDVPGMQAQLRLKGDLFELEDQRNWTDGSYKIFCTPSRWPCPKEVQKGEKVQQSVSLAIFSTQSYLDKPRIKVAREVTRISIDNQVLGEIPHIGLCVASHGEPLTLKEKKRLIGLNLTHLRVYLALDDADIHAKLFQATSEASDLNVPLEIALYLVDAGRDLKELAKLIQQVKPRVIRWLIFQKGMAVTPRKLASLAKVHLNTYTPEARFGGGSDADFFELNDNHSRIKGLDFVCYTINPQVHAYDNGTLVENLETQAITVESAQQFTGKTPIIVGPVTLKQRYNPVATGPIREAAPGELPPQVDVRQMSLFGACWTVGSLKYLLDAIANSITYYETTGWRGVMEKEKGCEIPTRFKSIPGSVFPLYHILADIGEFGGGEVIFTSTNANLKCVGLTIRKQNRMCTLIANLTSSEQLVNIHGIGHDVYARFLDETSAEFAMQQPEEFRLRKKELLKVVDEALEITLKPYAVVRLDGDFI